MFWIFLHRVEIEIQQMLCFIQLAAFHVCRMREREKISWELERPTDIFNISRFSLCHCNNPHLKFQDQFQRPFSLAQNSHRRIMRNHNIQNSRRARQQPSLISGCPARASIIALCCRVVEYDDQRSRSLQAISHEPWNVEVFLRSSLSLSRHIARSLGLLSRGPRARPMCVAYLSAVRAHFFLRSSRGGVQESRPEPSPV